MLHGVKKVLRYCGTHRILENNIEIEVIVRLLQLNFSYNLIKGSRGREMGIYK
jgi:hypothetical protein